jgi:GT2 family glycosyltransferase
LDSIKVQTYPRIETIVVDNNSTDDSMEIVERVFPAFRRIHNQKNLGFAEGNNVGIRASVGELVLLVNNDLILDQDSIASMVSELNGSASVGILGGVIHYYFTPSIWAYGGCLEPVSGMHWQIFQGSPEGSELPQRLQVDYVPGALLMIRRELLERVGLLDGCFFLYGDDIDLACKVRRLGYKVEVISNVKSRHMVSQSVKALDAKNQLKGYYYMNRNMFYLYFTQLPVIFALSSTISQIAFSLFEITIFRRNRNYVSVKIEALAQALKDLGRVKNERNTVKRLGSLALRPKIQMLLRLARNRSLSRTYYW